MQITKTISFVTSYWMWAASSIISSISMYLYLNPLLSFNTYLWPHQAHYSTTQWEIIVFLNFYIETKDKSYSMMLSNYRDEINKSIHLLFNPCNWLQQCHHTMRFHAKLESIQISNISPKITYHMSFMLRIKIVPNQTL